MSFKMPSSLSLNGNLANYFKKFKFSIEIYMKAAWHDENDTSTKTAILLNVFRRGGITSVQSEGWGENRLWKIT